MPRVDYDFHVTAFDGVDENHTGSLYHVFPQFVLSEEEKKHTHYEALFAAEWKAAVDGLKGIYEQYSETSIVEALEATGRWAMDYIETLEVSY